MKAKTCCFTGHRRLPDDKINEITTRLDYVIDSLIARGVTDFISGGALGFDQIAAARILKKKLIHRDIHLIFALPCRDHDNKWTDRQKKSLQALLAEADEVVYVSENYYDGCMKKRNCYMVERSAYCICALQRYNSGTMQTVNYAKIKRLQVIHII